MSPICAIAFETADPGRDSACAVGAVLVRQGRIADRYQQLIRPPRRSFEFTYVHGLTWADVRDSPAFGDMWPDLRKFVDDAGFLVAHNAGFDRSVLEACCAAADVAPPELAFHCTVQMARRTWNLPSASLPAVCRHLGIPLNHHDALSDAEACARIAIEALGEAA
ncbi:MAG: 3'-5' exonuclease [bacterium]|nr:3'-5' exonuclease [bacterium]